METSNNYYEKIACLQHIYLEDSWVVRLSEIQNSIEFELEAVLTKEHPEYHPPKPNEQYCYKKLVLQLGNCKHVNWIQKSFRPFTDANGAIDFGNIDHFNVTDNKLHLSGDWGEVRLECSSISLRPG